MSQSFRFRSKPEVKIPVGDPLAANRLARCLSEICHPESLVVEPVFICIGSDRSTGDSLGPLVGSALVENGMPRKLVRGTLENPVHAVNLSEELDRLQGEEPKRFVVAVDACLGYPQSVGAISVGPGPLQPGSGVDKELPVVGELHIAGVVNVGGYLEHLVLQNTRLALVVKMASVIATGIFQWRNLPLPSFISAFPLFPREPLPVSYLQQG
ncbi:MAG: spore protease YyaC [Firmicutes bacterium]|nr:spore protease YyaC [Bacillota bacterium]